MIYTDVDAVDQLGENWTCVEVYSRDSNAKEKTQASTPLREGVHDTRQLATSRDIYVDFPSVDCEENGAVILQCFVVTTLFQWTCPNT